MIAGLGDWHPEIIQCATVIWIVLHYLLKSDGQLVAQSKASTSKLISR